MPRFHYIFSLSLVLMLLILAACRADRPDQRLQRAGSLASDHPEEALACLDSIDPRSLTDSDRHLYDFLTVKSRDKAFIPHTSDSLILSVIDYANRHRSDDAHRAEALYYGGRVYSELGDYPTALQYFQQALDQLPDDTSNLTLRGVILSQTGQLMGNIGLYDESIPYILRSLEVRRQASDTKGEYYSLRALGYAYYMLNKYPEAELYYKKASRVSQKLPHVYRAGSKANLAEVKLRLGQTDSAIILIRNLKDSVKPSLRNNVLATAGNAYLEAGILDTTYIYAKELIKSERLLSKKSGFLLLLHPDMLKYSEMDSLLYYISQYRELTRQKMETLESDRLANQLNYYDYQKHVRARTAVEAKALTTERKNLFLLLALICSIIINVVTTAALFLKKKGLKVSTKKVRAKETLKNSLRKEELITQTLSESEKMPEDRTYCDYSDTPVMNELRPLITNGSGIPRESDIWDELEKTILSFSPEFLNHLMLLTGDKLTISEKHLALLIRIGIKNVELPNLIGISRSGVESRKATLCKKIFGKSFPSVDLFGFITCL